jgi:hypothetical protein
LSEKPVIYTVGELAFFGYFLLEWLLRFAGLKSKVLFWKDRWLVFDLTLLILAVVEFITDITAGTGEGGKSSMLRLIRLAKLLKTGRMVRVLGSFPELMVFIKTLSMAFRSVISTVVVMLVFAHVFALLFTQLAWETDVGDEYFPSVFKGMKCLILTVAFPDAADLVNGLGDEEFWWGILAFVYFSFASLALLNMLIAIMCEIIYVVSAAEREAFEAAFVKATVSTAFEEIGWDKPQGKEQLVTKEMFFELLTSPAAAKTMRSAGVDPVSLVDFADYIFNSDYQGGIMGSTLTFGQLVEVILELGGANEARVKDVVESRKVLLKRMEDMEENLLLGFGQLLVQPLTP